MSPRPSTATSATVVVVTTLRALRKLSLERRPVTSDPSGAVASRAGMPPSPKAWNPSVIPARRGSASTSSTWCAEPGELPGHGGGDGRGAGRLLGTHDDDVTKPARRAFASDRTHSSSITLSAG